MKSPFFLQRGSGLLEPLIAIVILSFGILGLARFQINMVSQATDAQARLVATTLSEELLSQLRLDLGNAPCYTVPQTSNCTSIEVKKSAAKKVTDDWQTSASNLLPTLQAAGATMPDANTFIVTLRWTSKAFKEARTLEVTTDVRP